MVFNLKLRVGNLTIFLRFQPLEGADFSTFRDNEATTNAVRFASNGRNLTSSFADKRSDVRTRMMRDIHFERR